MKAGDRFVQRRGPFSRVYTVTRGGRSVMVPTGTGEQEVVFWRAVPEGGAREEEFYCTKGCEGLIGIEWLDKQG